MLYVFDLCCGIDTQMWTALAGIHLDSIGGGKMSAVEPLYKDTPELRTSP